MDACVKWVAFVEEMSLLSPQYELIHKRVVEEGIDNPISVMDEYVNYMFSEFEDSNDLPLKIFFEFCEMKMDDSSIGNFIGISIGGSLLYNFWEQRYTDCVKRIAGPKTMRCLEEYLPGGVRMDAISRKRAFNKEMSLLSPEFGWVYLREAEDGFDDFPISVMERYVDFLFSEFDKSNDIPMKIFLDFCETRLDDASIVDLIGITYGESLLYLFSDQRYTDFVKKVAGPKTVRCLEAFLN
ncbi:MAG: hypothetical protein FWG14_14050 [Peptococcaceae bacterium]|nr:hypothetical protein [Peptococcaceae bacterium]